LHSCTSTVLQYLQPEYRDSGAASLCTRLTENSKMFECKIDSLLHRELRDGRCETLRVTLALAVVVVVVFFNFLMA
jgi:hypothetical protein